jgi:CRP/FNR family transcriptional regulator, cyclic AMP receptor protein
MILPVHPATTLTGPPSPSRLPAAAKAAQRVGPTGGPSFLLYGATPSRSLAFGHPEGWLEADVKVIGLFKNAQSTLSVPAGGIVFKEGESGDTMYGIVQGQIQLRTTNRIIATLDADDVFGEMAIVDSSPRMATAVATTETVLAVIDRQRFLFLVHETPMFALSVMSAMANRFRAMA